MNRILGLSTIGLSVLVASLTIVPRVQAEVRESTNVAQLEGTIQFSNVAQADRSEDIANVTSVSQLSDVKPTDWAFQALQSLVERYGCIAGYPDKTYRGNRAMTRYEFAAGLNACMDRVNDLIAASTADSVKKEDLATLRKLQEQFAAELATLRGRLENLEAKTATLEKQQFSTTTKLNGEVVFGLAGVATGQTGAPFNTDISRNTVMGYRARLNLDTSFTGEDLLRTRIQAGNSGFTNDATGIPEGSLRMAANSGSAATIDALLYQFPLGKNTTVTIEANAGAIDDFTDTLNPYLDGDGGSGALSHFGTRNPIYYLMGGTGIGIKHRLGETLELSAGYLAGTGDFPAATPTPGNGLFNGSYGLMGQLTFKPSDRFKLGVTYVNSYNITFASAGSPTGSSLANPIGANISSNSIGLGGSFEFNPGLVLNANAAYTRTNVIGTGDLDIWNWAIGLAMPDLGRKGNLAGLMVGMEPKVTTATGGLLSDRSTSIHVEGFYQYRVNDNLSITPGLIWLTAPNHDDRNGGALIGILRSTFTF